MSCGKRPTVTQPGAKQSEPHDSDTTNTDATTVKESLGTKKSKLTTSLPLLGLMALPGGMILLAAYLLIKNHSKFFVGRATRKKQTKKMQQDESNVKSWLENEGNDD